MCSFFSWKYFFTTDLNGPSTSDKNMTPELCQLFCVGFEYFGKCWFNSLFERSLNLYKSNSSGLAGVQYGSYCFCGNSYGRYGKAPESECNMPCSGDPNIKCGGTWRNSVYRTNQNAVSTLINRRKMFLKCSWIINKRDFIEFDIFKMNFLSKHSPFEVTWAQLV
jgi:hypothetical protein